MHVPREIFLGFSTFAGRFLSVRSLFRAFVVFIFFFFIRFAQSRRALREHGPSINPYSRT